VPRRCRRGHVARKRRRASKPSGRHAGEKMPPSCRSTMLLMMVSPKRATGSPGATAAPVSRQTTVSYSPGPLVHPTATAPEDRASAPCCIAFGHLDRALVRDLVRAVQRHSRPASRLDGAGRRDTQVVRGSILYGRGANRARAFRIDGGLRRRWNCEAGDRGEAGGREQEAHRRRKIPFFPARSLRRHRSEVRTEPFPVDLGPRLQSARATTPSRSRSSADAASARGAAELTLGAATTRMRRAARRDPDAAALRHLTSTAVVPESMLELLGGSQRLRGPRAEASKCPATIAPIGRPPPAEAPAELPFMPASVPDGRNRGGPPPA
jgi:hypothetical protein